MSNLSRLAKAQHQISIPPDENGFFGRECPECKGYFKIVLGTGLKGENLPCHCPYCGIADSPSHFFTKAQVEYAKSIVLQQVKEAIVKDLKALEFSHKPKGFGIGISMKVKEGKRIPIHYYQEEKLATEITCSNCTLRYSVYGVFAYCPDCRTHNSHQILIENFEIVQKMIALAQSIPSEEIAQRLIENALEDCISAFDGFGREICRLNSLKAKNPQKFERISFQNLSSARKSIQDETDIDIASYVTESDWKQLLAAFQKRHLLAHKMGVADGEYIFKTESSPEILGHKINISISELEQVMASSKTLGKKISAFLPSAKH